MPTTGSAELKEKVLALLWRLETLRNEGGGEILLLHLLEIAGDPRDGELLRQLAARGALQVEMSGDSTGTFRNVGTPFETRVGPLRLQVPAELAGDIRFQDETVFLDFAGDNTLSGKLLHIELRLERVELSPHHFALRLPGGGFDQVYEF